MDGDQQSPAALREWLAARVAGYVRRSPGDIRPDATFAECGLDSVYALMLCGEVEDHFGLVIEPQVAWDHPTVSALAGYLAGRLGQAAS